MRCDICNKYVAFNVANAAIVGATSSSDWFLFATSGPVHQSHDEEVLTNFKQVKDELQPFG